MIYMEFGDMADMVVILNNSDMIMILYGVMAMMYGLMMR